LSSTAPGFIAAIRGIDEIARGIDERQMERDEIRLLGAPRRCSPVSRSPEAATRRRP
jgi:hypothetical protein